MAHHPNKGLKGHNFGEKVVKKVTKKIVKWGRILFTTVYPDHSGFYRPEVRFS